MLLRPVDKRQLELRHARKKLRIVPALAHLLCHIAADPGDARIALVCPVRNKKIQLGIFFDLNAQLIKPAYRRVAGKEILRARSKRDYFQLAQPDNGARHGDKIRHHARNVLSRTDGIFGYITFETAQTKIIRTVKHAAEGVSPAADKVAVALGSGNKHARSVKILCKKRLRSFRTEVAKKHDKRIASRRLHIFDGAEHIRLILHGDGALIHIAPVSRNYCTAAPLRELHREAVAADGNNAKLDIRYIFKHMPILLILLMQCPCFHL